MKYVRYSSYEATYRPRDDEKYCLKDAARQHVGRRLKLTYSGRIENDRPLFAGEHEFIINQPTAKGLPVWFSELDLADIAPLEDSE